MRNIKITLLFTIITFSLFGQNINDEYKYIQHINTQSDFMIEDNLANALISLDSILAIYPNTNPVAVYFIEELANSFFYLEEYEVSIFLYLVEESLFANKMPQASRTIKLSEAYTKLAINTDIRHRLNSISKINPNITSPLIAIKYLNTKKLVPIIKRYIKTLRKKNTPLPKEIVLWESLVQFNIRMKKRANYFNSNFEKLSKKDKRRFFRKGNHYFYHSGNKLEAKKYAQYYSENCHTIGQKVFSYFLKARTNCMFH